MSVDVLVVGKNQDRDILDVLSRNGFLPVFRSSILEATELVHHCDFRAVILDGRNRDIDALEFILNIRDFDSNLPIRIIGQLYETSLKKAVDRQPRVKVHVSVKDLVNNLFYS